MQNVADTKAYNADTDQKVAETVPKENKDSQQSKTSEPSAFESGPGDTENQKETSVPAAAGSGKTVTTRKRYSRGFLEEIARHDNLKKPPTGFNPDLLKPAESTGENFHEGAKWNRNRNNRPEEVIVGSAGKGGNLRKALSGVERHDRGDRPERSRRNSRTEQSRWDINKDESHLEKRYSHGPERWGSYGHRDKEKEQQEIQIQMQMQMQMHMDEQQQQQQHLVSGKEPEWMKDQSESIEASKKQRQKALDFEGERRRMREQNSKRGNNFNIGSKDPFLMSDEEISKYQRELENESSAFTFDSLKAAMKQAGVSNLPPMPTSGASTVDQIEKSLKTPRSQGVAATSGSKLPSPAALERERNEVWKAISGKQNAAPMSNNLEGANLLLSLLRGTVRPTNTGVSMNPLLPFNPHPMPQPPVLPPSMQAQANNMFPGIGQQTLTQNNNPLERLFNIQQQQLATPSASILNLGLGGQQPSQTVQNPYGLPQQQPGGIQRSPLLSALLMNKAQQQPAQPMLGQFPQFQSPMQVFQSGSIMAQAGDVQVRQDASNDFHKLFISQASHPADQMTGPTPALMSLLSRNSQGGNQPGTQAKLNLAQMQQQFNFMNRASNPNPLNSFNSPFVDNESSGASSANPLLRFAGSAGANPNTGLGSGQQQGLQGLASNNLSSQGVSNLPHRPLNPSAQVFVPSMNVQNMLQRPQLSNTFPTAGAQSNPSLATSTIDSFNNQQIPQLGGMSGLSPSLNRIFNTGGALGGVAQTEPEQVAARRDHSVEELKNKA